MAEKNFPDDEEIFDLTDLIESGSTTPAGGAAAYAKAASEANNFESFLTGLNDDEDTGVDVNEKLDMSGMGDIENLLDSFDIPAQPSSAPATEPRPEPAAKKPAPSDSPTDELDSLLDDWLNPESAPTKAASEPAPPAQEAAGKEIDEDIHSILNEAGSPEPPDAGIEVETLSTTGLEEFDLPESPDFDGMSASAAPDPGIFAGGEKVLDAPAQAEKPAPMADSAAEAPVAASGVYSVQPVREMAVAPEMLASICGGIVKAQGTATEEALRDFAHKLGHQEGDVENLGKRVDELAKALENSSRMLSAAREQLALLEKKSHGLEELLSEGTPLNAGFMRLIGAVVGKALDKGQESGHDDGMAGKIQQIEESVAPLEQSVVSLSARLDALEAAPAPEQQPLEPLQEKLAALEALLEPVSGNLQTLGERISQLENDAAAPVNIDATEILARLDRMEGQEAGILAKFAGVEGRLDSLESGLGDARLRVDEIAAQDMGARLDSVAHAQKSINARIDALEKRLDDLEPRFNADIEKAAAKTVVKILHEEIARLMAGN